MSTLVTILILLAAILMISAIFLQPSKGDGFVGGGPTQTAMGSSGGTSFMFKVTMWCAVIIMAGSLFLSWKSIKETTRSELDTLPSTQVQEPQAPANSSPVTQQSAEPETSAETPKGPDAAPQAMAPAAAPVSPAPKSHSKKKR